MLKKISLLLVLMQLGSLVAMKATDVAAKSPGPEEQRKIKARYQACKACLKTGSNGEKCKYETMSDSERADLHAEVEFRAQDGFFYSSFFRSVREALNAKREALANLNDGAHAEPDVQTNPVDEALQSPIADVANEKLDDHREVTALATAQAAQVEKDQEEVAKRQKDESEQMAREAHRQKAEKERQAREEEAKHTPDADRQAKERAEVQRKADEKQAKEQAEVQRKATEQLVKDQAEAQRKAAEQLAQAEAQRRAAEQQLAKEQAEAKRRADEKFAKEQAEARKADAIDKVRKAVKVYLAEPEAAEKQRLVSMVQVKVTSELDETGKNAQALYELLEKEQVSDSDRAQFKNLRKAFGLADEPVDKTDDDGKDTKKDEKSRWTKHLTVTNGLGAIVIAAAVFFANKHIVQPYRAKNKNKTPVVK